MARQDSRLQRIDAQHLQLPNRWGIPVRVLANSQIPLEATAVAELLSLLEIQDTVARIRQYDHHLLPADAGIAEVVLTPDFHKGAGIPIGTVLATRGFAVPQAIGNDVNCGMRLTATSLTADQVRGSLDELESVLRHIFFEGGRQIPMTPGQREALLRYGLPGLIDTHAQAGDQGLWKYFESQQEESALDRMHGGGYATDAVVGLDDYVNASGGLSYDSQIGNVGGGNHFAELQFVRRIHNGAAAHAWGLTLNQVVVMIHSGSLGLGHQTGQFAMNRMREFYPDGLERPTNGIYPLPTNDDAKPFAQFRTSMRNAANFAFGNRFFLSLMVRAALEKSVKPTDFRVVYDAPHNLMWEEQLDGSPVCLHRKGATPARGYEAMAGTDYEHWGEPVIVPGSMGAPSYLLAGAGNRLSMCTACHGAGRSLSRGQALAMPDDEFDEFLQAFRIVTPIDPNRPDLKRRRDIIDKWRTDLKKEAPFAYKDITPVVDTLDGAGVASPVVELYPLLTVKS